MGRATPKGNEAKSKMKQPSDMLTPEIRTQVVVICGPTRYQLDHGGGRRKTRYCHRTKSPPSQRAPPPAPPQTELTSFAVN